MIYAYGVTQQGAYHIKNNVVCQDAHKRRLRSSLQNTAQIILRVIRPKKKFLRS